MKRSLQFSFKLALGLLLAGMLLSACSLPGSPGSTPASNSSGVQGVTAVPINSPHMGADKPPAAGKLPNGTPLPANAIKPLTFNLIYNDAAMEQAVAQIYAPG